MSEVPSSSVSPMDASRQQSVCDWLPAKKDVIYLLIALLASAAAMIQGCVALNTFSHTLESESLRRWQEVSVYRVIRNHPKGISFAEILDKYRGEAQYQNARTLPREELSELALERVLLELEISGVIYVTTDGKYIAQASAVNPRPLSGINVQEAKYAILKYLNEHGGRKKPLEVVSNLHEQTSIPLEDVQVAFAEMYAAKLLVIDDSQRVWTFFKPPKSTMKNEVADE